MDRVRRRTALIFGGGALAAAAAGVGLQVLRRSGEQHPEAAAIGRLWTWPLQDLQGGPSPLERWRGKPLVVNFWATWCEPCRTETPLLVKIQQKYAANGLQMIGISLDSAAKVTEFAAEFKIPYPLLIASLDAIEITRDLGNKAAGLPYTVVLNRQGKVLARHLGGISEEQLEQAVAPLLVKPA